MANNCNNYITITGNKTQIKEFSEMLKPEFSKHQNPSKDIYQNLISEFGNHSKDARWFDIDVHKQENSNVAEEITISGDSAWCPCLQIFKKIAKRFSSFKIRYEYQERGEAFAGYAEIKKNSFIDVCLPYWEGIIAMYGEKEAFALVYCNELEDYDNEAELIESDMYNAFSDEIKKEILESYNNPNN